MTFRIYVNDLSLADVSPKQGGVYSVVVTKDSDGKLQLDPFILTAENTVHMLWLIPQYFLISCGEIMVSITGLELSYSQAPVSMKAVVQSCWLLTVAIGNAIDMFAVQSQLLDHQVSGQH